MLCWSKRMLGKETIVFHAAIDHLEKAVLKITAPRAVHHGMR
jgi:hypothetical protein